MRNVNGASLFLETLLDEGGFAGAHQERLRVRKKQFANAHSSIAFDLRYAASQLLRARGMRRATQGEDMASGAPQEL